MKKLLLTMLVCSILSDTLAQTYRVNVFNKASALSFGKSYFKGIDDNNEAYMPRFYELAFDNHMAAFKGTVDIQVTFNNLGSCKVSHPQTTNTLAYCIEMTATLTNNTNFTMISRTINVGFPDEPTVRPSLYPPAFSIVACSLSADYHTHFTKSFPLPGGLSSCGIYPKDHYLILNPGESATVKKREWTLKPSIYSRPFYERGEIAFCEYDTDKSIKKSSFQTATTKPTIATPPVSGNSTDTLAVSINVGPNPNGCGYLFYQDSKLKKLYLTTVFQYSVLPQSQGVLLETGMEKSFYNVVNKYEKLPYTYEEFKQKIENDRNSGVSPTSGIGMERGVGTPSSPEEKQVGRVILTCEEATLSRKQFIEPLKKTSYKIMDVKVKPVRADRN